MTNFVKIPKIFDGIKVFPPSIVENSVDIVDKTLWYFPQWCVENENGGTVSFFGDKWKIKGIRRTPFPILSVSL